MFRQDIISFLEILKISKNKIPKIFFLKENKKSNGIFGKISFFEVESSKLINYWTNMCTNAQGSN
jgi:hypothetical protein